ncbi:unnamed protein product [Boreogadus saida]
MDRLGGRVGRMGGKKKTEGWGIEGGDLEIWMGWVEESVGWREEEDGGMGDRRPPDQDSDLPEFVRLEGAPYHTAQFLTFRISSHFQLAVSL